MISTRSKSKTLISFKPPVPDPCRVYSGPSRRLLSLRLKSNFDARARTIIQEVSIGLPALFGSPIFVGARPHLKAQRGKLVSGRHERGMPVHAASFIRHRRIILETQLLRRPDKLRMIVAHEIFHFVWARLGNRKRAEYAALIQAELQARARGELGESAAGWKEGIESGGDMKNYVCESFCDTAAWLYSGARPSRELTLAARWRARRRTWFEGAFGLDPGNAC